MRQEALTRVKGYLAKDAELRRTRDGRSVLGLTVPFQRSRFNKQTNEYERIGETLWTQATLWDEVAEAFAPRLLKGTPVIVEGVPEIRLWEKDGRTGTSFELLFAQVSVVADVPRHERAQSAAPQAAAPQEDAWATPGAWGDDTPF